jgi:hypothetical protein
MSGRIEKKREVAVPHLAHRHLKCVDIHAVDGLFLIAPGVAPHEILAAWDERTARHPELRRGWMACQLRRAWMRYPRLPLTHNPVSKSLRILYHS